MESIEKAAIDNKDKYDDQVENIGALNTSYESTEIVRILYLVTDYLYLLVYLRLRKSGVEYYVGQ